jgi:hypothetical protein
MTLDGRLKLREASICVVGDADQRTDDAQEIFPVDVDRETHAPILETGDHCHRCEHYPVRHDLSPSDQPV